MTDDTIITDFELALVRRVQQATFPPGMSHKRFIRDLSDKTKLTDRGRWYLAHIAHRYRRQYTLSEEQWAWIRERLADGIPGFPKEPRPANEEPALGVTQKNICPLCSQETPMCRCDLAQVEMKAKLTANNDRWREETRQAIAQESGA